MKSKFSLHFHDFENAFLNDLFGFSQSFEEFVETKQIKESRTKKQFKRRK